jgi:hypothetical protein
MFEAMDASSSGVAAKLAFANPMAFEMLATTCGFIR